MPGADKATGVQVWLKDGVRHLYVALCRVVNVVWPSRSVLNMYQHYTVRKGISWRIGEWLGEAVLGEGGRLQGGCVAVAIGSRLALQAR